MFFHYKALISSSELIFCNLVRRSSTKKSDYFAKRYSQPQIDTGHEFTFPTNLSHQHSEKQSVSPSSLSPVDVQRGLNSPTGNKRKPYLSGRSQLYRFSCDDYHTSSSSNTIAVGSDKCHFDIGGGSSDTTTTDIDTIITITDPDVIDDKHFDFSKMQSDSVSASSSAQNRCLTEQDETEPVATNVIDLATDNLPAVDTPDACDKAALR